jgi:capsid protein
LVLLAKRRVSVTRLNSMAPRILDHRGQHMGASDTAYSAASRRARELAAWQPPLASADVELAGESPTIAARSYDLERNHGVATDAIRVQVGNIVGTGLRLAAKPDYRALGRDKASADAWGRATEAHWRTFADIPEFEAARQLHFGGTTVLQLRSAMLAGDGVALVLWLPDRPGAKWATAVQCIDPARLSNPDWRLRDGVEINEYGEPVAYWIRRTHRHGHRAVCGAVARAYRHHQGRL